MIGVKGYTRIRMATEDEKRAYLIQYYKDQIKKLELERQAAAMEIQALQESIESLEKGEPIN